MAIIFDTWIWSCSWLKQLNTWVGSNWIVRNNKISLQTLVLLWQKNSVSYRDWVKRCLANFNAICLQKIEEFSSGKEVLTCLDVEKIFCWVSNSISNSLIVYQWYTNTEYTEGKKDKLIYTFRNTWYTYKKYRNEYINLSQQLNCVKLYETEKN